MQSNLYRAYQRLTFVCRVVWGVVCMCLAAPQSYAGFAAVRFLLGFAEGAVSPAFVTITSIWYQKNEHALRTGCVVVWTENRYIASHETNNAKVIYSIWVSMNGIAQIIGCLLMYGIGKNSALSLAPWRTLFIICGAMTSAAGVAFYLLMPNGPNDAWFLSAREKEVLSSRMAQDREGGDKTSFSMRQLKEAMMDSKAWFVFAFGVLVTMQSPVLTVCWMRRTQYKMLWMGADTSAGSLPLSSSTPLAMTSSKPCCIRRHRVLSRSSFCGSVWQAASSSHATARW
jgi:MFS family permease